jgi:ferritin-like metal-binding protein YciE
MTRSDKNPAALADLFWRGIGDLYSAEEQLMDALPRMVERSSDTALQSALLVHLEATHMQLYRLQQIYDDHDRQPERQTCKSMQGLIDAAEDLLRAQDDDYERDAGIIAAAQRFGRYEMSGYRNAHALAVRLGNTEAAAILEESLDEEREADATLHRLAQSPANHDAAGARAVGLTAAKEPGVLSASRVAKG